MSTALNKSPDWTDLLKFKRQLPGSQKKKKEHVTPEQREELLDFILENPEMVTRSSTRENEAALWDDVTKKLNAMKPEKSVQSWKIFWKNWRTNVETKNVASLTIVDYKLKKFIKNIEANFESDTDVTPYAKKKLSHNDICKEIEQIDAENIKIKLDDDRLDYTIAIHKTQINLLKELKAENRKRSNQLDNRKASLNIKKKKIEEKENLD